MLMSTCYPGFLHWTVYKTLIWVRVLAHLNVKMCMDGSHRLLTTTPEEGSSSSAHEAGKASGGDAPSLRSPLTHCPAQRKCSINYILNQWRNTKERSERHALLEITWKYKFKFNKSLPKSCTASCNFSAQISLDIWGVSLLKTSGGAQSSQAQAWNSFEISCLMLKISPSSTAICSHNSFDT